MVLDELTCLKQLMNLPFQEIDVVAREEIVWVRGQK